MPVLDSWYRAEGWRGTGIPVQKLPNLFPSSDPGLIGFSTCGRRGAHGVAQVGTTSDYDRQDYFQISYIF